MGIWSTIWAVVFAATLLVYLIVVVFVSVGGLQDIRSMLQSLDRQNQDSDSE